MIDPKSLAGVLLREHDNPKQAFEYAMRKARLLQGMGNAAGCDYLGAAQHIQRQYELPGYALAS